MSFTHCAKYEQLRCLTSLTNDQLSLHLNNDELKMTMNDKVLGIIIDNNLTWSQHVDKVYKKLQQTCGFYLESKIT